MPDLEKVSKGLCDAIGLIHGYIPKRYWGYGEQACRDAITLLKEQEPVPPEKQSDGNLGAWESWWYVCGACGREIDYHDNFCRSCGREVKWS